MEGSLGRQYGITAYSIEDAKRLLKQKAFPKEELPRIIRIIESIEFKDLDENHIVPNMGPMIVRGVWYPNLLNY